MDLKVKNLLGRIVAHLQISGAVVAACTNIARALIEILQVGMQRPALSRFMLLIGQAIVS